MTTEKHHYIGRETLRETYMGCFDMVKSLTKVIAGANHTHIAVDLKKNHIIQFIIIGGRKGVEKSLKNVIYQFEKSSGIPGSLAGFVHKSDHKQLQQEHNSYLLTEAALRKFNVLTGSYQLRQFACGPCDHPWWKCVAQTKPVSSCKSCRVAYNALDREKEFGIGRYLCLDCDHAFYARCDATQERICFKCDKLTGPPYINPRFKPETSLRPRRIPLGGPAPPARMYRRVINASTRHFSTGSTVGSFITEDIGPDIPVQLARGYDMIDEDYPLFEDSPMPESELSTMGEVNDFPPLVSEPKGDFNVQEPSSFQEISCFSEYGKVTPVWGSDLPDSARGARSDGRTSSVSARMSMICEFNIAEYPGIVFSKRKDEVKMTSSGGEIVGEGAKLIVPPGAVSASDEVTLSLQACIGGPFCLPKDLVFLSPVYLIEPPFAFHKNVTLSIKLFVDLESDGDDCDDEIFFVTSPTKHTTTEDNEVEWKFKRYSSQFNIGSNIGEIDLKHFCFGAFAGFKKKCSYRVSLYVPLFFTPPQSHVIFSVTLSHEVYTKNLERYIKATFGNEKFVATTTKLIKFSASGISLKLPLEDLERQGYGLTSDKSPCKIMKEEVECGKKSSTKQIALYPPRISLCIFQQFQNWADPNLMFSLLVEGAQENFSLTISLPSLFHVGASYSSFSDDSRLLVSGSTSSNRDSVGLMIGSGYSSQGSQAVAVTRSNRLDEEPDLTSLYNCLFKIALKWEMIAVYLGLGTDLSKIDSDDSNVDDKLRKVLILWKKKHPECYKWRTIVEMLEQVSENEVAKCIRDYLAKS